MIKRRSHTCRPRRLLPSNVTTYWGVIHLHVHHCHWVISFIHSGASPSVFLLQLLERVIMNRRVLAKGCLWAAILVELLLQLIELSSVLLLLGFYLTRVVEVGVIGGIVLVVVSWVGILVTSVLLFVLLIFSGRDACLGRSLKVRIINA